MYVTLNFVLVALFAGGVFSQYLTHPYGGVSFVTNSFHHIVDYSYVAPSGQTVNVKYSTSASVQPTQRSATPHLNAPQFVFPSAVQSPAPLALSANQDQQFSIPTDDALALPQNFSPTFPARPPTATSLFTPAHGASVESEKQFQAYQDYLIQLAQESTTETQISTDADPEAHSYVSVKLGGP